MTRSIEVRSLVGINCCGYLRVSTARQASPDKVSLEEQQHVIEQKAHALGLAIGEWFSDPGASGGDFARRAGIRSLYESCKAHPRSASDAGVILVMTASRFS